VALVSTFLSVAISGSLFLAPIAVAIGLGFILRHIFQATR
jgi:hypothetical protein